MTQQDAQYAGWPNRETWLMAQAINAEPQGQEHVRGLLLAAADTVELQNPGLRARGSARAHRAHVVGVLAEALKDWQEEHRPVSLAGVTVWDDLLGAAFARID
jgi:hypothetical protein